MEKRFEKVFGPPLNERKKVIRYKIIPLDKIKMNWGGLGEFTVHPEFQTKGKDISYLEQGSVLWE